MNALQRHIQATWGSETEVMNQLQDAGVISDNCVTAQDVGNAVQAVEWLKKTKLRQDGNLL